MDSSLCAFGVNAQLYFILKSNVPASLSQHSLFTSSHIWFCTSYTVGVRCHGTGVKPRPAGLYFLSCMWRVGGGSCGAERRATKKENKMNGKMGCKKKCVCVTAIKVCDKIRLV